LFSFETDAFLTDDREDLIAVLQMRFGPIPGSIIQRIYQLDDMNTLQRLILTAANAADWQVFMEELNAGSDSFKLVGEEFNPLRDWMKGGVDFDGKTQE
jgi:hypothetical protein